MQKAGKITDKMLYEELRFIHEDIERLEQAVADRVLDDPKHVSMLPSTSDRWRQSLHLTDPA